jgi:hypothetical protein
VTDRPEFGDPEVADALRSKLGMGELKRLRALMAGGRVCPDHPAHSHERPGVHGRVCPCGNDATSRRFYDAAEERQRERDDAATGLSLEQREALLGGLAAMYAAGAAARLWGGGAL